ncbi:MAG: lysylphosphatidylglycerol synthase transmembrane domain-containing protein [Desulfovermiculus sp.]|nr:lysylphosphatidylglycerol synthase transmembrane domain-containing protein [Desulfovermiculus sp.]
MHIQTKKFVLLVKIITPIVLLSIIFQRINFEKLLFHLLNIHIGYLILAFSFGYVSYVVISSLRWKLTLSYFYKINIPFFILLKYYWVGLFIGYFIPAGVGGDIYRAINAGRYSQEYEKSLLLVFIEKFSILIINFLIIICTYPFLSNYILSKQVTQIAHFFYLFIFVLVALLVCLLVIVKSRFYIYFYPYLFQMVADKIKAMSRKITSLSLSPNPVSVRNMLSPLLEWKNFSLLIIFTILNRMIGSIGGYFLLKSVGVDLSLLIHFFTWTLILLIFSLPISIGTLGVREGTYILFFGLFGVQSEVALAASFAGLACMLASILIGGFILLLSAVSQNIKPQSLRR